MTLTVSAAPATPATLVGDAVLMDEAASARERLLRAGVAENEAGADAELLARHALGWDRATWLARRRESVPVGFTARYAPLVARRERREPVSQITGEREFWGLRFAVGPTVLTPRPETELIVETALEVLADRRDEPLAIADIGTGSGCLAVTLAREFRRAVVTAVDLSRDALRLARRNAAAHGVAGRIQWVRAAFEAWLDGGGPYGACFDLTVANLPYIPSGEIEALPAEVRDHEPRMALDGGVDGLVSLRELFRVWRGVDRYATTPSGAPSTASSTWLLVEMGAGQADAVRSLVDRAPGLDLAGMRVDLRGIPRVAMIRRSR
ncbi:MAG: peptide chain release factor N(5)-glutamine methyltransferase [Acidobacteria bacterium]|nr:peptide chain release factor N(5)-glutamine methyltransferase [Acidobacteriota bacterium]MYJ05769.1 peptide chain release factor N(5)-glutamine methyltransferase [Acidobacteriota bacterium]